MSDIICKPYNTAIRRNGPSAPARRIKACLSNFYKEITGRPGIESVLDYGCGRGEDVIYYSRYYNIVRGYDPHPAFGHAIMPTEQFDVVTMTYVLNTIPEWDDRQIAIDQALERLKDKGLFIVTVRGLRGIQAIARRRGWGVFSDGYWSNPSRGTFQAGFNATKLYDVVTNIGHRKSLYFDIHFQTDDNVVIQSFVKR